MGGLPFSEEKEEWMGGGGGQEEGLGGVEGGNCSWHVTNKEEKGAAYLFLSHRV